MRGKIILFMGKKRGENVSRWSPRWECNVRSREASPPTCKNFARHETRTLRKKHVWSYRPKQRSAKCSKTSNVLPISVKGYSHLPYDPAVRMEAVTNLSVRGRRNAENSGDPDDEHDRSDEQGPSRHD